jgi:hypothetical protein
MPSFGQSSSSLRLPFSISYPLNPLLTATSTGSTPTYFSSSSNPSDRTRRTFNGTNSTTSTHFVKPRSRIHLAAFNVRTLKSHGQQTALAMTLDALKMDVCSISGTRIQDPSIVTRLEASNSEKQFWLRLSGDPAAESRGTAGVGVALSAQAESALLDCIPVNSRLCAIRLKSTVKVRSCRPSSRNLFVISVYAPTDCSSDADKNGFYTELHKLLNLRKSSDIVVMGGDFNAQVGQLGPNKHKIGGRFAVRSRRTDNGDRLVHTCSMRDMFLCNTNLSHNKYRLVTWRPSSTNQPRTQIDHMAISYRWRGCIQGCQSSSSLEKGLDNEPLYPYDRLVVEGWVMKGYMKYPLPLICFQVVGPLLVKKVLQISSR